MKLVITPSRAATVAESSNPVAAAIGLKWVRQIEAAVAGEADPFTALAYVRFTVTGHDAETAAGVLYARGMLRGAEADDYLAAPWAEGASA